jgi:hypothetical protein
MVIFIGNVGQLFNSVVTVAQTIKQFADDAFDEEGKGLYGEFAFDVVHSV